MFTLDRKGEFIILLYYIHYCYPKIMYELFWLQQTLFPMDKSWIDMPRNTP